MDLINSVFRPYLDSSVFVFIDYILISSCSKDEHKNYLEIMLGILKVKKLNAKLNN